MIDQGISSLSNLALSIVIARQSSQEMFGAFAIVFAIYLISLGCTRALFGDVLLLNVSTWARTSLHGKWLANSNCSLYFALLLALCMAIASTIVPAPLSGPLVALSLSSPLLLMLDNQRYWSYATQNKRGAAWLDAGWLTVQILLFTYCIMQDVTSTTIYVLAWGLASGVPLAVTLVRRKWSIQPALAAKMFGQHRALSTHFLGEYLTLSFVQQAITFTTALFGGLQATGALRAAQTIMGPANVVTGSANVVVLPKLAIRSSKALKTLPAASGCIALVWALFIGLVALMVQLIPHYYGRQALGSSWEDGQQLATILAVTLALNGIAYGATSGLRAIGASKVSLQYRLASAPVTITAVTLGAMHSGATGALWGLAISTSMQAAGWWILYLWKWHALRQAKG